MKQLTPVALPFGALFAAGMVQAGDVKGRVSGAGLKWVFSFAHWRL
jgi:hypothetical protein